ncbi:MAG: hypothetical protein ACT4PY_17070 [Armatimonadota bacterium]
MGQKLFEVAGECPMPGLPTGGDIARVGERLEQARRRAPQVVRTAVQGPAAFKDRVYVLEGRFVVWADDGERAVTAIGTLLDGAKISYRSLHLSGRALTDADAPRPKAAASPPKSAPSRKPAAARGTAAARGKKKPVRQRARPRRRR